MKTFLLLLTVTILGACAMFTPILPTRNVQAASLREVIDSLGLTTNLKLVLDAGDVESWPGNGQKWLDRSGGGYDFFLGADGTASATDPTFNGNVGNQRTEYFSADGGDYFTYDSANETWMKSLGKAGSHSFVAVVYVPSSSAFPIVGADAIPATDYGGSFVYNNSVNKFTYRYITTAPAVVTVGGAGPDVGGLLPALFLVGIGITKGADGSDDYVVHVNGTNYTASFGADPGLVPTSNDPAHTMRLLATGNADTIAPSGTRLYALAVWEGTKLSPTNYTDLWNALHARFGL